MKPYPYLAVVSPEAPAGTLVYQLQAHDGDEGKSGEVEYFLSDGKLCDDHIHTHAYQDIFRREVVLEYAVLLLEWADRP